MLEKELKNALKRSYKATKNGNKILRNKNRQGNSSNFEKTKQHTSTKFVYTESCKNNYACQRGVEETHDTIYEEYPVKLPWKPVMIKNLKPIGAFRRKNSNKNPSHEHL